MNYFEGPVDQALLRSGVDARVIVEACFSSRATGALLYAANVPERFFDLSSGVAGEILQKLRNYRIRLAVVCAPGGSVRFSSRFGEMLAEESRTGFFQVFASRETALEWLKGGDGNGL